MDGQNTIIERIDISPGSTWTKVCWVFAIATIGLTIFLLSANFSRREQATGFLVAEPRIIRIDAPRNGRVQRVAVHEGQVVQGGDVLVHVDPDPILVDGKSTAESEIDRLRIVEQELRSRIQSIGSQVGMKIAELTQRIEAVTHKIAALREGVELQRRTIALLSKQLAAGRTLQTSGAMSINEAQKRETALRDAEISAQNLLLSLHENEATLAELTGQKTQMPIESELRISDLRQSLVDLEQRRAQAQGRLAFQVTAPVTGTVDTILIASGQTINANSTLISLLPETSILVAELYVPSRAIVFIEQAQPVRIAYSAFPYARYGFAEGKVASVSETILRPEELQKTVLLTEPSYRVTVSLQSQTMKVGDREIRLRPGLAFTADIILDRRTLAQWILYSIKELWART